MFFSRELLIAYGVHVYGDVCLCYDNSPATMQDKRVWLCFCGQAILPSSFSDSADENVSPNDDISSEDVKKVCC